jgi:serine/threonine protein kinase
MIVMKYYENGNLYQYLDRYNGVLSWRDMIDMLWGIAGGLERIHAEGKVHKNLHGGNLLIEDEKISTDAHISDVGLYGPCKNHENKSSDQIYGVLPYVAPEVLPRTCKPRISFGWCKECETNFMKENFIYWTSGNKEIDELISHTQL